jgi:hypothetical protein
MRQVSAHKAQQKTLPNRWPLRSALIIFFAAVSLAVAMGAWSFLAQPPEAVVTEAQSTTVSSIARNDPFTIIISSPKRNDCRRY